MSLRVAGLNSTPALIGMTMFIIYLQALNVSYVRSTSQRDKKGRVSRMKTMRWSQWPEVGGIPRFGMPWFGRARRGVGLSPAIR